HDGGFNTFEGTINLVDGKPESSSVSIVIDTTSMFSDNDNLTEHLKSADFFEVETYPTATFASNSITPVEDGTPDVYDVVGNLTLHGVTKQISFPATITVAGNDVKASAEFSVMRFDYGIEYKGAADDLIRDEVVIKLDIAGEPLDELMPETPAEETAS
ncbi:MAG: YceI family protein, partial [Acidobacteriota bacterium]